MSKVAFPITTYTDPSGSPLSLGYLTLRLNTDAKSPSGQVGAQGDSRIELDVNGVIAGSPTFWPNAQLVPNDTVYLLSSYTNAGQIVLNRESVTV